MPPIHVHQVFHAVGHGTFHTGFLSFRGKESFCWIYDCGSKSSKAFARALHHLPPWISHADEVDLLVLSHFDDDHVNGLEELLLTHRVRYLALPFMDVGQSLRHAASIADEAKSPSTVLFQLNPIAWLEQRQLNSQVGTLLIVGGSRDNGSESGGTQAEPPFFPPEQSDRPFEQEMLTSMPSSYLSAFSKAHGILALDHQRAMSVMNSLELKFFNSTGAQLFRHPTSGPMVTRRSKLPLQRVQADLDQVMKLFRLDNLSSPPRKGWRNALRKCYEQHFGSTSADKNNISLCLMTRPMGNIGLKYCSLFNAWPPKDYPVSTVWRAKDLERAAVLCLGDLSIDPGTRNEIIGHFGKRMQQVALLQVPHHGSRHSWTPGNAAAFSPDVFIHCVPNDSKFHPHIDVERDLASYAISRANYESAVQFSYHFNI